MTIKAPRTDAVGIALACLMLCAGPATAQIRYESGLRFRAVDTPHFTIYYHQGEEQLARRLAGMVEQIREAVASELKLDAPSRTHVILVDQADMANGWSSPSPYNTIEISASPPAPASLLGNHHDWLELVFAHEYTHIVHLNRVAGVMRLARKALGRHPLTFPNLYLPAWQVEGIATYVESAVTGRGRVNDVDTSAILDAIDSQWPVSIDQMGGGLVRWPGGHAPYLLGGAFHGYLSSRFSASRIGQLATTTASRLPFFGESAFGSVFGLTAQTLWRQFESERKQSGVKTEDSPGVRQVTHDGFMTSGPRYVPGRISGSRPVLFTAMTPDRFPSIRETGPEGGQTRQLASRYLGETLSTDGHWAFFDQVDFDGPVGRIRDLYAVELNDGRRVRLSTGARLSDPDISRDGRRLAVVAAHEGRHTLAVYPVTRDSERGTPGIGTTPLAVATEPDCDFATPRWSPDGSRIAASRQCTGRPAEIVVFDPGRSVVTAVEADPRFRSITPAWFPDGRSLIFASDRDSSRFQLYLSRLDGLPGGVPRRLLAVQGGALSPDISEDGTTVVFLSTTGRGYDVFEAPIKVDDVAAVETQAMPEPAPIQSTPRPAAGVAAGDPLDASREYSPWATLLPRAWFPTFNPQTTRTDVGATTQGTDVLGRHSYRVSVTWPVSRTGIDIPFARSWRPDLQFDYAYDRWRPTVLLYAADRATDTAILVPGSGQVARADTRQREMFAGAQVVWSRVRLSQTLMAGLALSHERFPAAAGVSPRNRNAFRAVWSVNSSRLYGYSISPEDGVRSEATVEIVTPALGADAAATASTADLRAYLPGGLLHSVIAVRMAAAASSGDSRVIRLFGLGDSGAGLQTPGGMAVRPVGMMRGIGADARVGRAITVFNMDYRIPLARVEHGVKTWPVFLNSLHAAAFLDVGSAGSSLGLLRSPITSIGVELSSDFTLGYVAPFTFAIGAARVHDPLAPPGTRSISLFVRVGRAF